MFTFASALVEHGWFQSIEINFLIVGHTHSSIDQYFSVLSKAIYKAEFIGSPLSIQALCSQAHKDGRAPPAVNRQIEVYYDIQSVLKPYINSKIKFFQVPHCFVFRRLGNKCIMQYKLFTSHSTWLPEEPPLSSIIQSNSNTWSSNSSPALLASISNPVNHIVTIPLDPLATFDGRSTFFKHIGITGDANGCSYLLNNPSARNRIDVIDTMLPIIQDSELTALHILEERTRVEENEGHLAEHKEQLMNTTIPDEARLSIQAAMRSVSQDRKGYIIWIIEKPDLPPISSIIPPIINVSQLIRLNAAEKIVYGQLSNPTLAENEVGVIHSTVISHNNSSSTDLTNGNEVVLPSNSPVNVSLNDGHSQPFTERAKDIVKVSKAALDIINGLGHLSPVFTYFRDKHVFDG